MVKIQRDGAARSPWSRPSAPGCGDTSEACASLGSILGGDQGNLALGSPSAGSLAGRTPLWRRLNVQSGLRQGERSAVYALTDPSVAARDRVH